MTYEEFVTEYESLVTALLSDNSPKVPGMIYSRTSEKISSKLADLVEAYPEYEDYYDETVDERYPMPKDVWLLI